MNMEEYRKKLKIEGLTDCSIKYYVDVAKLLQRLLADGGRCSDPRKIGPEDVAYLLDLFKKNDFSVKTRKGYYASLKKWCRTSGNRGVPDWPRVRFPPDRRPRVDWLSPDQVRILMSAELDPLERLIVHLELCLGLRRIETIRLRVHDVDFDEATIRIRGKGAQGDKPRTVPFTVGTRQIIGDWLAERGQWITACLKRHPKSLEIPDEMILWMRAGRLYPYRETGSGYDDKIERISKKVGFKFSNHTLRRTFGRALYRSGVPVPTISKILGHESMEETIRYLGVNLDDMREVLTNFKMIG